MSIGFVKKVEKFLGEYLCKNSLKTEYLYKNRAPGPWALGPVENGEDYSSSPLSATTSPVSLSHRLTKAPVRSAISQALRKAA